MFILFRLWQSKVFWKFFAGFIVSVSAIGFIIGYVGSKGYFEKQVKVIGHKYCYFYNPHDLQEKVSDAMASENTKTAKTISDHYMLLLNPQVKDTTITFVITDDIFYISKNVLVDLIKYSSDSSLVLIRTKQKVTGYVPVFTLHDTLPVNLKP